MGRARKSRKPQNQQRRLKRRQKMEEVVELQELKKQKLVLENVKLARELDFITQAQCLGMARCDNEM